jgi:cytoskeletal protein RodZ
MRIFLIEGICEFRPDRMLGMSYQAPRSPAPWMLWVRRHKVLTALGGIALLLLFVSVAAQAGTTKGTPSPRATSPAAHSATRPSPSPTTAAPSSSAVQTTAPAPVPATSAAVSVPATAAAAPPPPPPRPATTAPPPPPKVGCHPLTNAGNCYEPGEFCRKSDHGVSGVAGDGKSITCENNDGWRWEPA